MKSFIAALLIVIIVVILIGVNAYFTRKATDELLSSVENFKKEASVKSYDALVSKWNEYATYFSLTVARENLHKVEDGLKLISLSFEKNSEPDLVSGISNIEMAINKIAEFSALDFLEIL